MLTREEFLRRYPGCDYDAYVKIEDSTAAYYSQPPEVIDADLCALAAEYRELGYSFD